jgi:sn-glycerol 3-phosphate transport system ATP-binding protein
MEVADGEFIVIVGPSGCGKSTLLRMVAGLETVSHGEIRIDGVCVNDREPSERDIAMVFQNYALYPHMSVYGNMAYGLKIRGLPKDEIRKRVEAVAQALQLDELLHRRPGQLSGGQRQRVAMGRAIVREPKVFLFDEPLSNLDAKLRVAMRLEILKLHERLKTTSLYVTHDQVEAMTLAHRMVVMKDGVPEQIGTPMEVFEKPATLFVAGFIGSPPMNLIPVRVAGDGKVETEHNAIEIELSPADVPRAARGRSLVLGMRPEHMMLDTRGVHTRVEMIETLGSEQLVHCRCGDDQIIVVRHSIRDSSESRIAVGMEIEIGLDGRSPPHWFEADTGQRVFGT